MQVSPVKFLEKKKLKNIHAPENYYIYEQQLSQNLKLFCKMNVILRERHCQMTAARF